jgi:hypothetical protein
LLVSFPAGKETQNEAAAIMLPVKIGPLSVLDDRYAGARSSPAAPEGKPFVSGWRLFFAHSGLPEAMLMDPGVRWWNTATVNGVNAAVTLMDPGVRWGNTAAPSGWSITTATVRRPTPLLVAFPPGKDTHRSSFHITLTVVML